MFMFTPIIPLLLVVSSPFCGAVPALVVHDLPLNDSADGTANITGRGVTQNPAILFLGYIVDDCYCTVDYCDFQLPDATCFPSYGASYNIQQFYGDCRFMRVFSGSNCDGDYADLGTTLKCWDVSTRNSFQIYC